MLRTQRLVIWAAGFSLAACATAQQAPSAAADGAASATNAQEAVQPKIAPLLLLILGRVATEIGKQVGSAIADETVKQNPGLFSNLLKRLGWHGKADAADDSGLAPAVGYTLQQLDPRNFEVLAALAVGEEPTVLKTGDVFAIQYSTNLPGQIRLENVDPVGRTSDLGTYTVLVDQLNRLPRERGIRLEGEPGVELLRLYFYPCLPPEAAGKSWEAQFKGRLPNCGHTPNIQVAAAALGTIQPRTLVNLAQPDTTVAFMAVQDYRMNEVTLAVARIKHESAGHGQ